MVIRSSQNRNDGSNREGGFMKTKIDKKFKDFTFTELIEKDMSDLLTIKKQKQTELMAVKDEKLSVIANIISLQGLIDIEKGKIDENCKQK